MTLDEQGRPKNLTYTGQTKTGETIQIDDFDFKTRSGREVKMPLALKQAPRFDDRNFLKIFDQMRRQAEFTRDWDFSPYVWEMHSHEDEIVAEKIRRCLDSVLANKIRITTIH
jgi:hypothetical protein